MEPPKVVVIIPAFNEQNSIGDVVENVKKCASPLVIDDASNDETALRAKRAGAEVISLNENYGYSSALNHGFKFCLEQEVDFVITCDADGQHPTEKISFFIKCLKDGNDVVLGVRSEIPRFMEKIFAHYTYRRFKISDPLCGMKGYTLKILEEYGGIDKLGSFGAEVAIYSSIKRFKKIEIPIITKKRNGYSKVGGSISANFKIFISLIKVYYFFK